MVTDSVLLDIARISGLPFDVVEQKFRGGNVEANGNTFNKVSVNVVPNWGEQVYVSNVTGTGSIVPDGHVYICVGDSELVLESAALRRALAAVHDGTNSANDKGDSWGW